MPLTKLTLSSPSLAELKRFATWKFLRAEVDQLNSEKPVIQLEYSREYVEKLETEAIFRILKTIVSRYS
jgi:hypothetical protein